MPENNAIDETKLPESDQRELKRFRQVITKNNADMLHEEQRFRREYGHWVWELFERGGNIIDEFNFKTEAALKLAQQHAAPFVA